MNESRIYSDLKRDFRDAVPPSIREVVVDLINNSLWLEICRTLYRAPINMHMTQSKLIEQMKHFIEENHIDYLQLNENIERLKGLGYIHLEEKSMPDHFLTPKTVEAMKVINAIEKKIVEPLVKELKNKGFRDSDIKKRVRQDIYLNLK